MNTLFFITDQQRADTLGCYGNAVCRTPNADRLAERGVRFDCAFTPTSICTAARGSLLTGVMPHKHGLLANFERNVGYPVELPEGTIPFSRYLREKGCNVGTVGKWHVGVQRGPADYEFDGQHYPGWCAPVEHPDYVRYLEENGLPSFRTHDPIRGRFPNGQPSIVIAARYDGPVEATYPYFLAERTIGMLRRYAEEGKPFFLACQWFGPHLPYYIPDRYYDMYDPEEVTLPPGMAETFTNKPRVHEHYSRHWAFDSYSEAEWRKITAIYWGYVTLIDEQMGRVLAEMERLGLADETTVLFTTDHGAFVGSHKMQDKGPAMYDDTYHIPLLASMPGGLAGTSDDHMVSLIDLPPTFLDLAGAPVPDYFDGRSLVPLLQGKHVADWREYIIAEFHGHHFPYPQRMIRTHTHKLVVNPPDIDELYDLVADPNELANQIDNPAYADVKRELFVALYRELRASGDNFYHWMTTMYDVGEEVGDASLSHIAH
ncbi:MAG: sulfatase-like hydrolase/transferase [Caldilineaceae bacterium]